MNFIFKLRNINQQLNHFDILNSIYQDHINDEQKGDLSCGIFTSFLSFAEFIGPILGGLLADKAGFSLGCYLYAFFLLIFLMIYFKYGNAVIGVESIIQKRNEPKKGLKQNLIELDIIN